jgi:UDP-N-acetylmuramoyl-tripeptide--D-alanyl-D-alanine ligase
MNIAALIDWPIEAIDDAGLALWTSSHRARRRANRISGLGREIDSRDVLPGDLFFALKGEAMDNHRFVRRRLNAARRIDQPIRGPHIVKIPSPRSSTSPRRENAAMRGRWSPAVARPGKEAIFAALIADRTAGAPPVRAITTTSACHGLAAAQRPFGVFEMGMNHAGEIASLATQVCPHVAVITTVPRRASKPRQRGSDRRCQGRDIPRTGTGRHGGDPGGQPALLAPARSGEKGERSYRLALRLRQRPCSMRCRHPAAVRW